ncbi:adenosylcobalamin-dependent ribonucleoside-diphosphate reductase [Candidatus Caldatribacterium sp. SIUC1]|uniref:adenosylcobalamin-dependent ribonucleoside-diphosphate reductase n=1 Tax=Candidatus Caldatribacterium sp. SIUC1 TaxID=3418365 RepID=UPI003F690567
MPFEYVRKRDGTLEPFQREKIVSALSRALSACGREDPELAHTLAEKVVRLLSERVSDIPEVERIQDIVEEVLMREGLSEVARTYILYREKRRSLRKAKWELFGVRDDLKLSLNAVRVLKERYLLKDSEGNVIETPKGMMERVARSIAEVDRAFGEDASRTFEEFFELLTSLVFLPNSPTLMNAGTSLGQLSACFVLPVEDSIDSIFTTLKEMAIIHKSGGGTGFSFSALRPKGDIVASTGGRASGPVSFMRIFDAATDVVKQGGRRRGANMGVLRFNHPDIREFIRAKEKPGFLENFNLSVAITDEEIERVKRGDKVELVNPRDGKVWERVNARELFETIAESAWRSGEPGLLFLDTMNRANPTPHLGDIVATNPCGEVPLLPYESCNLGSLNLAKFVRGGKIQYDRLREVVWKAVHFLDNVIEANRYPLEAIEKMVKGNRKIGLGVMGFADMLVQLGIPYFSEEALKIAAEVMHFIALEARMASLDLAARRGTFPNYPQSVWAKKNLPLRNATLLSIAPTGSISIIASCSSGIEPLFALAFRRYVLEHTELVEVHPLLEEMFQRFGIPEEVRKAVLERGTMAGVEGIPETLHRLFLTALEIPPEFHVRVQATFQKYVDNAVSKTVNLPESATPQDVFRVYLLAHELGCKGITVYRYESRPQQVLYLGVSEAPCEEC